MSYKAAIAAALLAAVGTSACAQGITGGELGIEYNAPTGGGDLGGTTYTGGLEYGITRQFGVAGNLSSYRLDNINTDATNLTLHGIYNLSDSATVGAFVGRDNVSNADSTIYGIEGGTEFMGGSVEAYVAKADRSTSNASIVGADGTYAFNETFAVVGNAGYANFDNSDSVSRFALGAQYNMASGPQFYAEIGSLNEDTAGTSDSQTFIGIGARVSFGASRGTTFGSRSLYEVLPGF